MLTVSVQLPCGLFTCFDSLGLRITGTCFFYTFLSRLPFVRLSLGVDRSAHHCYHDFGLYIFVFKVQLSFLMRYSLTSPNYVFYLFASVCILFFAPNFNLYKVFICLLLLLPLLQKFKIITCFQDLNVPYILYYLLIRLFTYLHSFNGAY